MNHNDKTKEELIGELSERGMENAALRNMKQDKECENASEALQKMRATSEI
ncbi:MAG: hypothetical protein ACHQ0Y_08180 [Thermodesulfovibrionales bacterium]